MWKIVSGAHYYWRQIKGWAGACVLLAALSPWSLLAAEQDTPNGIFLIAKPGMQDPNFRETVVLVTQDPNNQTLGVIVNRPTTLLLNRVFPENKTLKKSKDNLFFGGPVARPSLIFLFRASKQPGEALHVLQDVYLSTNSELLNEMLSRPKPTENLRIYAGYSGWAPGQLQGEMKRGDWYVINADTETIFKKDPKKIWPELVKRASSRAVKGWDGYLGEPRMFPAGLNSSKPDPLATVFAQTQYPSGAARSVSHRADQAALNSVETLDYAITYAGKIVVKVGFKQALASPPAVLIVHYPGPRIVLDFPDTANKFGKNPINVNRGGLRSLQVAQAGDRTRLVIHLDRTVVYQSAVEGNALLITLQRPEANRVGVNPCSTSITCERG